MQTSLKKLLVAGMLAVGAVTGAGCGDDNPTTTPPPPPPPPPTPDAADQDSGGGNPDGPAAVDAAPRADRPPPDGPPAPSMVNPMASRLGMPGSTFVATTTGGEPTSGTYVAWLEGGESPGMAILKVAMTASLQPGQTANGMTIAQNVTFATIQRDVLIWGDMNTAPSSMASSKFQGRISAWKPGMPAGGKVLAMNTFVTNPSMNYLSFPFGLDAAVSPDGNNVVIVGNHNTTAQTGDIFLVPLGAGQSRTLAMNVTAPGDGSADPIVQFTGNNQFAVVATQANAMATTYTVQGYPVAGGNPIMITNAADSSAGVRASPTGAQVAFFGVASGMGMPRPLQLINVQMGAQPQTLDMTPVGFVDFSPNGALADWFGTPSSMTAFPLKVGSVMGATNAVTVGNVAVASGSNGYFRFTRDSSWIYFMSTFNAMTQGGQISLTRVPGMNQPVTLVMTGGTTYDLEMMSPNNQALVWYEMAKSTGIANLVAAPVSNPSMKIALGPNTWSHTWVGNMGGKVVYNQNSDGMSRGDVTVADTAAGGTPNVLQTGAYIQGTDANGFFVSGGVVLFTMNQTMASDGVYALRIP